MAAVSEPASRTPIVCVDECAVAAAVLFDPNPWSGNTKGLIQSCWSEYSVLHHCTSQIVATCKESKSLCARHITKVENQWTEKKFDLEKVIIFGQEPDLHLLIEAFFSGVKSLLDLLVQLLSSGGIVNTKIDGFHRNKDIYGGTVLNALENNVPTAKKDAAAKFRVLISANKTKWIDQAISARDLLVHPEKGMFQLMFMLEFIERNGKLVCVEAHPPAIGGERIDQYAQHVLEDVDRFTSEFIRLLGEISVTNNREQPMPTDERG